ncbi:MAG: glycosyltransferase family 2 protein [Actinobacteria bacterium]|nr:glycosyltransferase family 2 protein [Actinomycetota bacterium]
MKLVMTLLARDEADVIEAWLAFHLNAGADFVIATDNRSQDGTTDVLEAYAREGYVHLLREAGDDLRQNEWVTRMARLAATDFGADWVINSDADEFWWPRGASLGDVLAAVPERYGTVGAFLRTFGPPPDGGDGSFAERMMVRFSALAPINDPASLFKPIRKVVHRAHPEIQVTRGNHALVDSPFAPLRGWYPIEVFHFPLRSHAQCERKATLQGTAFEKYVDRPPTAYHANMFAALKSGKIAEYYDALVLAEDELERGLGQGRLVEDTRLRDALRSLRRSDAEGGVGQEYRLPAEAQPLDFPIPSLVEDAEYAVEAAVLGEADVVRLQRRLDTLERRLLSLELRLPARVYRKLSGTAKRALRRDA